MTQDRIFLTVEGLRRPNTKQGISNVLFIKIKSILNLKGKNCGGFIPTSTMIWDLACDSCVNYTSFG